MAIKDRLEPNTEEIRARIPGSLFQRINEIRVELKTTWPKLVRVALELFLNEHEKENEK